MEELFGSNTTVARRGAVAGICIVSYMSYLAIRNFRGVSFSLRL